ncbi:MAG: alpha/beta hydrolase [Myxococcota bacterium]
MNDALAYVRPERIRRFLEEPPKTAKNGARTVAYDDHLGVQEKVWFWFHGSPSSRLEALLVLDWAEARGIRLIALDRPGIGGTTPSDSRTALSVVDDLLAVADREGIERFTVLGGSGGGPYALACAYAIPDRLDGAVITAPGGVASEAPGLAGWIDRGADWLARRAPWALVAYFRLLQLGAKVPAPLLRPLAFGAEGPFVRAVLDSGLGPANFSAVFAQGSRGVVDDFRRLGAFGFPLSDIRTAVLFVHGERDPFVPSRQTEGFAARVPRSTYVSFSGLGHGGAIFALDRISLRLKGRRGPVTD